MRCSHGALLRRTKPLLVRLMAGNPLLRGVSHGRAGDPYEFFGKFCLLDSPLAAEQGDGSTVEERKAVVVDRAGTIRVEVENFGRDLAIRLLQLEQVADDDFRFSASWRNPSRLYHLFDIVEADVGLA